MPESALPVAACCSLVEVEAEEGFDFFLILSTYSYTNKSFPTHQTTAQFELSNFTKRPYNDKAGGRVNSF